MKFIKTPVKGMVDMLPSDVRLRQHVLQIIRDSYASSGFMEIETPVMEHIENLTSKQGGDNEKLIFRVMKRGADLKRAIEAGKNEFADNGLRYDLTLPLSRYYSNNMEKLPSPFKALQIGNVWRADNPQKGRFRQFTQCDIDILGDDSDLAEIELIAATSNTLSRILGEVGISDFTVHVNDRRILKGAALKAGFSEDDISSVLISLDKYDKIGLDGIRKELVENGAPEQSVDAYLAVYAQSGGRSAADFCAQIGEEFIAGDVASQVNEIIDCASALVGDNVHIVFDPTLVRGMGYYTGTIFEVSLDGYGFSIAGGGRYDEMVGKFTGHNVSACGFSIGFERIITILKDKSESAPPLGGEGIAVLVDKKVTGERKLEVLKKAQELRQGGAIVTVQPMKKNMKQQISKLEAEGYSRFEKVYRD